MNEENDYICSECFYKAVKPCKNKNCKLYEDSKLHNTCKEFKDHVITEINAIEVKEQKKQNYECLKCKIEITPVELYNHIQKEMGKIN